MSHNTEEQIDIYNDLGLTPVINAIGNKTTLGGSTATTKVRAAMDAANEYYVDMPELMEVSGERIATLLDVEAAFVTSGCASAIVHAAAGVMAGTDKEMIGRLPDTTGMRNEFIFQQKQRYFYDRCYVVPGGQLVIAGDEHGCTIEEMEAAIGPNTAAIGYVDKTRGNSDSSLVSIEEAMAIGGTHGLPVIVDAAYQSFPIEKLRWIAGAADIVCFGGKYFGAPSSTGFLCGRSDLVQAASRQGFVASQSGDRPRSFGRSMKVDRQEIVGMVVALEEWLTIDHEDRILGYLAKARVVQEAIKTLPSLSSEVALTNSHTGASLSITFDPGTIGKTGLQIKEILASENPSILLGCSDTLLHLALHTLHDGQEQRIADRLLAAFTE